ncbi:hypothetical protein FisN_8Hh138 [Fistulifera solaris]|uniref:N-acetyltransferase domain-containing protein n=1 Tax=Fistulifera solaris TaxID=1519565 RepID=A0A1Z5JY23_FISSO|nr:hypothetical protein FisN_8Hh138 [Fistulifera solaris]|eukprot:GAX18920.1 hypothetical protein FisN_8Hh138 [Fistulifera solaris]
MSYLSKWPESFVVAEAPQGQLMGYVLGKAEGEDHLWHGHVSAVTVSPQYRRLGLAKTLMDSFENLSIHTYNAYFVDLFVRASNHLAIQMYQNFGYSTYRRVLGYYSGYGEEPSEDALDMRKALPRDVEKASIVPLDRAVRPEELEW